ncbi:bifunctional 5,10-methylenetetrahydrofolate dehydrogenase/5,10-methenyltetrahydrofolate cyclohydrolase [Streptomyces sp. NPDC002602]|uniref:bifunctional 5,10-methylenetetrahydrofolate dehydrogenase/5,10-methenyltetrahydrofolate cyclohydrolase n=1 Tax=Streptomyces sp. NPDC002602 TaxID=3364654 RepID=UPI003697F011
MTTAQTARLMDGTAVARRISEQTAVHAAKITERTGTAPCLATVLVGEDPASVTYVRMKQNRCAKAGITSRHVELPAETTTGELVAALTALSEDPEISGILLQHPVPHHIDERAAFEAIAPGKDVDGVTMHSFAAMGFGLPGFVSCTPGGIMRLLEAYDVDLTGKHAVVVGRSAILGKPAGMLLLERNATVTYCHSRTVDLPSIVRQADVLDAGYNAGNVGDVHFESAAARASLITPVPGGVGPMTIAVLLEQTVRAAAAQAGLDLAEL